MTTKRYVVVVCPGCGNYVGCDTHRRWTVCPHTYPVNTGTKDCRARIQIGSRKVYGQAASPQDLQALLSFMKADKKDLSTGFAHHVPCNTQST